MRMRLMTTRIAALATILIMAGCSNAAGPSPEQSRTYRLGFSATSPVLTVGVDSIDESLKKVEAEGGTIVRPKTAVPGMGAFAYFKDTEGNVLGVWESV